MLKGKISLTPHHHKDTHPVCCLLDPYATRCCPHTATPRPVSETPYLPVARFGTVLLTARFVLLLCPCPPLL